MMSKLYPKLQTGGLAPDKSQKTKLTQGQQLAYEKWKSENKYNESDDYDLAGYWKEEGFKGLQHPNLSPSEKVKEVDSSVYPTLDKFYKENPHVAGMNHAPGEVSKNPYSKLPLKNLNKVIELEKSRDVISNDKHSPQPKFKITKEQTQFFKDIQDNSDETVEYYNSPKKIQRQTLASRELVEDPKYYTKEQHEFGDKLRSYMYTKPNHLPDKFKRLAPFGNGDGYMQLSDESNVASQFDKRGQGFWKGNQFIAYQQGGTLSQLGYKRHSPYNQASSLLIDTPTGSITMKEVDHPIIGISKGEIQIMHPEKEYKFKSNKVLEMPMRSVYPKGQNGMKMPKVYTDKNEFVKADQSYQDSLYLHNIPSLYKERLTTEEGARDIVLNKALPVLKRILDRNNIKFNDYEGDWDSENLKFPRPNQPVVFKPKMQQGGTTPEMSPEQQQEIVRRVRNLRKTIGYNKTQGVPLDGIAFRHALHVNKHLIKQEDQELLGAFDENQILELMNNVPDDDQPMFKKGGSIKGKSKMYPKCKCGCGGVSVGKNKMFQQGGMTPTDSLRHQASKIMDYEALRGYQYGTGLPNYGNPQIQSGDKQGAINYFMNSVTPYLNHFKSAMEKGEAGDFVYNTGRDPRIYMLDQFIKSKGNQQGLPNRGSYNLDMKSPEWNNKKQEFETEWSKYSNDIQNLPENQRRVLLNKGRDFYYQNIDKQNGQPNPAYKNTWYGRIWNTNDFKPFDPSNPNFSPKYELGGTMDVLDGDGNSQMTITGGERIFSRIATRKMLQLNEEGKYKELGKFICDELYLQDKREPQYVKE